MANEAYIEVRRRETFCEATQLCEMLGELQLLDNWVWDIVALRRKEEYMEQLWAPWRMEYILSDKTGKCILCQAQDQTTPQTNYILHKTKLGFVIMNIYPYNSGHLMVVPCRHVAELEDLTEDEQLGLMNLVALSTGVLKQAFDPQGFNIGMNMGREAGAGIETHLHWHVVPRWRGDTNFMPILANTKVISQYVAETYHQLRPHFPNQKG